MKTAIVLLLIIIAACLANSTLTQESFYDRGSEYYPHQFVNNECPCLSCIDQPCASPYKT